MSVFGSIMGAIFGHAAHADVPSATAATAGAPTTPAATSASSTNASTIAAATTATAAAPAPTGTALPTVDVAAVLDKATADGELDWRRSIVDLMKALKLDSSLAARKELAKELNYTGDTSDSATMNIWLHKQVMAKLAANGGKVPVDIKV